MALTAAILNSLGALAILIGAWVQGRQAYDQFSRHRKQGDVKVSRDEYGYLVPAVPLVWANVVKPVVTREAVERILGAETEVRVPVCDRDHFDEDLSFLPSPRTIREHRVTFAGWFGWELIFVGGALVLVGSILMAVDAA